MFPLKTRRLSIRLSKNIPSKIVDKEVTIIDLSLGGFQLKEDIDDNEVKIEFEINSQKFNVLAQKVRKYAYEFKNIDDKTKHSLEKAIYKEYFKDTPELIPEEFR